MPQKKGQRKPRRNRRRKSKKPKPLTLSAHQASTKKYDSRIEKVIARVARQEDQRNKQKLIYRQYLFGPYTMATNVFAGGKLIDYAGVVCPLAQIQLVDNKTTPTVIPTNNPNQNPQTWQNPGVNVIAAVQSYDGFRRGTWLNIHGINVEIRALIPALSGVGTPRYDSAQLRYKIILAQWSGSDLADARPDVEETKTMIKRFGFSAKLDLSEYEESKDFKLRTLHQGLMMMRCNTLNSDVKFHSKYLDLSDKPVKVEYNEGDQSGRRVVRWKPFIVFQSDIPAGAGYDVYKPLVHCCTKLYYTDT